MNDTARAALADATETAVLVLVPEAEAAVGKHRRHLDTAASWGVPAPPSGAGRWRRSPVGHILAQEGHNGCPLDPP